MLRIPQPPLSFCKVPSLSFSIEPPRTLAAILGFDPASLLSTAAVLA
jgi:hypothetical protein